MIHRSSSSITSSSSSSSNSRSHKLTRKKRRPAASFLLSLLVMSFLLTQRASATKLQHGAVAFAHLSFRSGLSRSGVTTTAPKRVSSSRNAVVALTARTSAYDSSALYSPFLWQPSSRTFMTSTVLQATKRSASASKASTTTKSVKATKTKTTSKTKTTKATKATKATKTTKATKNTSASSRPYKLVIVESPSKCKTIENILQNYVTAHDLEHDYVVTSCYGHIRNLPKNNQQLLEANLPVPDKKSTSHKFPYQITGVDLDHDYKPTYVMLPGKEKIVHELQTLSAHAACQQVLLATDPDREGEAIAWHLQEVLELTADNSERLTFTEITPRAIEAAVAAPIAKRLNTRLVAAQETRRILDRLAGFTVSPVLWKKIAPGLSAGRVQSVGMALVVQRERERLVFQSMNYWDMQGNFSLRGAMITADSDFILATLSSINGTSLVAGKVDFVESNNTEDNVTKNSGEKSKPYPKANKYLLTEPEAAKLAELLQDPTTTWQVKSVQGRERLSYPPEPFKTSTLQQESNQRLGMSVSQTMRTAQQLYEAGWISYMRTDATYLSEDALAATVLSVTQRHGPQYVSTVANKIKDKRKQKKKSDQADKVAQEAHEAIRPAIQESGNFAEPQDVTKLPEIAQSLYELIFRRTLSSRMPPQKTNQTTLVIEGTAPDGTKAAATIVEFRATGSVVLEPGFTLEWNRGDPSNANRALPPVFDGQDLSCHDLEPLSHDTQPPARYTEASLVKELEALGVGRPSTYAGIVQILRDRAYVGSPTTDSSSARSSNKRKATGATITAQRAAGGGDLFGARGPLAPSLSAFVVTSLLEQHCPTYVDPSFTAQMEENLDRIANGNYHGDGDDDDDESNTSDADDAANVEQQRVAYLNEFYAGEQGLAAQIKRIDEDVQAEDARRANLPALQHVPKDVEQDEGGDIGLYIGPWGPYIQQKPVNGDGEPVNAPLPPGMATDLSTITPGTLKALIDTKQGDGVVLGQHPADSRSIRLKVGRFGAYLQWGETGEEGTTTHSLPKELSTMRNLKVTSKDDEEDAPSDDLSEQSAAGDSSASLSGMLGVTLQESIAYCGLPRTVSTLDDKAITAAIGPYGPYLKYNNKFVTLRPRDGDVVTIDAESAERVVVDGIINRKSGPGQGVLAELGEKDGSMVTVKKGRFGDYLNWSKVNAKLPEEYMDDPEQMPLDEAWILIQEKAASSPSKATKAKQSNLPPAPKRPKTSYLHFCAEHRPKVAETLKSLGEISKKLAELWAETPSEERKPFEELAQAGKEEYKKEKSVWERECRKVGGKKKTMSAKAIPGTPPPPKRSKSAYLYFCDAKRPEVSKTVSKLGDISKRIAEMWAETTGRDEYTALADADKARYVAEKAQYAQDPKSFVPSGTLSGVSASSTSPKRRIKGVQKLGASRKTVSVKRAGKTKKKQSAGTKSKRAPSAYMIFCRETRHEIVDENGEKLPLGETTKRLAQRWKERDQETRAKFDSMAAEEKEKLLVNSS